MNDSYTLRPVSISRLKRGGGGVGEVVAGFWGSQDFQGEWRGDLSSPIEYKEGTIENWLPIRGIISIIQSLRRGREGVGWGGDEINFIVIQLEIFLNTPSPTLCDDRGLKRCVSFKAYYCSAPFELMHWGQEISVPNQFVT